MYTTKVRPLIEILRTVKRYMYVANTGIVGRSVMEEKCGGECLLWVVFSFNYTCNKFLQFKFIWYFNTNMLFKFNKLAWNLINLSTGISHTLAYFSALPLSCFSCKETNHNSIKSNFLIHMLKLIIFANFFLQFVIQINSKFFLYLCINFFKVQEDDITMIIKLAVVF